MIRSGDGTMVAKSGDEVKAQYYRMAFRKLLVLIFSIVGIILFVGLFSVNVFDQISLSETYEIIWNHITGNDVYEKRSLEWWADKYIFDRAIPHVVVAIIAIVYALFSIFNKETSQKGKWISTGVVVLAIAYLIWQYSRLNGSIEIAPILGLSDVIVDIVETGTTLRENNLEIKNVIMPISARLIANKTSFKFKDNEINSIMNKIKGQIKND